MENNISDELRDICAQWWADRLQIVEKRELFKQALLPKIHDEMDLWVDYDPNKPLLDALHEAGIECKGFGFSAKGILPMKTGIVIRDGVAEAKVGYGGKFITLGQTTPQNQM